jgi:hypothetical protein
MPMTFRRRADAGLRAGPAAPHFERLSRGTLLPALFVMPDFDDEADINAIFASI